MNNITYLFGAGASYQSIPVQRDLNKFIKHFLTRLEYEIREPELLLIVRNNWVPFMNLATEHTSIDTFAKKLFITNQDYQLWLLKLILSAYFIYEQSFEEISDDIYVLQNCARYAKRPIDPRYDFFMAALLKVGKTKPSLPENLKIVSWNYDSQIEMSFHPYSKIGHNDDISLREYLNLFPPIGSEFPKKNVVANDYKIIKLNGTAAHIFSEKTDSLEIKSYRKLFYKEAIEEIKTLIGYSRDKIIGYGYINHGANINFAWELQENWFSKLSVDSARDIISETSTLVVVGYSFPVFNREIDKYIFEENKFEKIYIQDKTENINGIKSRACKIMNVDPEIVELEPNVDQFLIPFEL